MASASTLLLNEPARVPHFSPHRKAKANDKGHNLRKNAMYKSLSVRFSILGENPSEEVLDYDNHYYYE